MSYALTGIYLKRTLSIRKSVESSKRIFIQPDKDFETQFAQGLVALDTKC